MHSAILFQQILIRWFYKEIPIQIFKQTDQSLTQNKALLTDQKKLKTENKFSICRLGDPTDISFLV